MNPAFAPAPRSPAPAATIPDGHEQERREAAVRLITDLHRVLSLARHYDVANEIFEKPIASLIQSVAANLALQAEALLAITTDDIFVNHAHVYIDSRLFQPAMTLRTEFARQHVGSVQFSGPITAPGVKQLARAFARSGLPDAADPQELNARVNVPDITFGPVVYENAEEVKDRRAQRMRRALNNYGDAVEFLKEAGMQPGRKPPDGVKSRRIVQRFVELSQEQTGGFSLAALAQIKNHDEYTFYHMVNVCVLAVTFGANLGLSRRALTALGLSALFHDYGKLAIPLHILNKPGKFDEAEWAVMRSHTAKAVDLLYQSNVDRNIALKNILVAIQHHITFDHKGYPEHLRRRPHLFSRIVSIVDCFDAMTTNRIYQRAMMPDKVIMFILAQSGKRYDPLLTRALALSLGLYPAGSLVVLNTNQLAVVLAPNPSPRFLARPTIRLVHQPGVWIDLAEAQWHHIHIQGCTDPMRFGVNVHQYLI